MRTPLNNPPGNPTPLATRDEAHSFLVLARIENGGFAEVEAFIDGSAESVIVHRQGDGVRAWLNVCPHAGRRLDWAPGQFLRSKEGLLVCAAHGASFEPGNGECVAGPCRGEALRAVAAEIRDGQVLLGDQARGGTPAHDATHDGRSLP